jgi:hypothetical protein
VKVSIRHAGRMHHLGIGTRVGQACPDHGLEIAPDVDNATLQRLAQGEIADPCN